MKRKKKYPGTKEAEKQKGLRKYSDDSEYDEEPDFIGGAPNYDKWPDWDAERVLVWLNID